MSHRKQSTLKYTKLGNSLSVDTFSTKLNLHDSLLQAIYNDALKICLGFSNVIMLMNNRLSSKVDIVLLNFTHFPREL